MNKNAVVAGAMLLFANPLFAGESEFQGRVGGFIAAISEGEYSSADSSPTEGDSDGLLYGFEASAGNKYIFAYLSHTIADHDLSTLSLNTSIDVTDTRMGVGLRSPGKKARVLLMAEKLDIEFEVGNFDDYDDKGQAVHVGLELDVAPQWMLTLKAGAVTYADNKSNEGTARVSYRSSDRIELYVAHHILKLDIEDYPNPKLTDTRLGLNFHF